jgi:uncharacterized LabA/DUF88 family protein
MQLRREDNLREGDLIRVITYVDGFNLYFGLKSKGFKKYYWLDLPALAGALLKPGQELLHTHYFTTRIRLKGNNQPDVQRQTLYLEALAPRPQLSIHYGHYLQKNRQCRSCGAHWADFEEKMTDVNMATQLLSDAFDDAFDTAMLVSADSDLTTPVVRVRQRFPNKRIIVVPPPGRQSVELTRAANGYFHIGEDKLRHCQLPSHVTRADGYTLQRPANWK